MLLLAALALGMASAVLAAEQATATLSAKGDGSPRLYMSTGSVQISGAGTLMVSSNAKVTFTGTQQETLKPKPGRLAGKDMLAYASFTGVAVVTGEHFAVGMYGNGITASATGAGYAMLFGTGTYTVGSDAAAKPTSEGKWTLAPWMKGGDPKLDVRTITITFGTPSTDDNPVATKPPTTSPSSTRQ
jgi:hypothetical protein